MVCGGIIEDACEMFVHLYNTVKQKVSHSVIADIDYSKLTFKNRETEDPRNFAYNNNSIGMECNLHT